MAALHLQQWIIIEKKSILAKDLDHHPWFSSHLHADNMDIEAYWECILDRHTSVYTYKGKIWQTDDAHETLTLQLNESQKK